MSLNDLVVEVIERIDIEIGEDGSLEADVFQEVELVISLEDEFGIKIPDDDRQRFRNVAGIVAYISTMKTGNPEPS